MNLSLGAKVGIGLAVSCVLMFVVAVFAVVGMNNTCVQMENGVTAQYSQNQNNYDNMWKKFKESSQVNENYAGDLKTIFTAAIQGRYGADGSKAVFQMLKEQNPNLDPTTYRQLQQLIESGRNTFEVNQKMLIDKKQSYNNFLGVFPNSVVVKLMGFPRIDLAKYDIVTSDSTTKAFESKKADEVQLRTK